MMRFAFHSALIFLAHCTVAASQSLLRGGNVARETQPHPPATWLQTRDVRRSLLGVLNSALDTHARNDVQREVARIEDILRPLYRSLPKNSNRLLGHNAVRYALHRYLARHHGMYVKGLEPSDVDSSDEAASSPTALLADRLPAYVHQVFEAGLAEGFSLNDLAVMAAAFEHILKNEADWRLAAVAKDLQVETASLTAEQGREALHAYLKEFLGTNDTLPPKAAAFVETTWAESVRARAEANHTAEEYGEQMPSYDDLKAAVEVVWHSTSELLQGECADLRRSLVESGNPDTGRVALEKFYALLGQPSDSAQDYSVAQLRSLGVLDERDPAHPSVIIPNYITSKSNCLATSSLYMLCCADACDSLLAELEVRVGGPDAAPEVLANYLSALSSERPHDVPQPSEGLRQRLDIVAQRDGGRIRLHGRAFAQWMHKAFPLQCAAPFGNATSPRTPDEWLREGRAEVLASSGEAEDEAAAAEAALLSEARAPTDRVGKRGRVMLRSVATVCLLALVTAALACKFGSTRGNGKVLQSGNLLRGCLF
eukprot:TRINITY_DN17345_c0_g1_i3.p1 TRINITY_DN17345_c0_g1~~TRINITY_DN17345_c0_g1_i3.p1  ORF type:complete len:541 (-),score=77.44 TRINITY_DN17345_c0_g1_i3:339-1961(-)